MDTRLSHEEVVEQSAQVVQSGRLSLLTSVDPSLLSSLLGDMSVWLMESGDDVMRIDALESHSAADIVSTLCRYLEVSGDDLMTALRMRGESGTPVCVVIDNVECLEGKALQVLKSLTEGTSAGVGLLLGGEPDAQLYLEDAGIVRSFLVDVDTQVDLPEYHDYDDDVVSGARGDSDGLGGIVSQLPWRHLFAATGLALLAWLFWPTAEPEPVVRDLDLPAQVEPAPMPVSLPDRTPAQPLVERPQAPITTPAVGTPPARLPQPAPKLDSKQEPQTESKPAPKPVIKPAPKPKSPADPKPTPPPKAEPKLSAKKPVARTQAPSLTGLAADLGYHQEEWLLTRAKTEWVLQVALATSEDGARSLLDQIGRSKSAYYRAERNDRHVYIVLAGPWPTREAAVAAKTSLPQALRTLGAFPRELSGVHKEVGSAP